MDKKDAASPVEMEVHEVKGEAPTSIERFEEGKVVTQLDRIEEIVRGTNESIRLAEIGLKRTTMGIIATIILSSFAIGLSLISIALQLR
jgi:hypothetical protein